MAIRIRKTFKLFSAYIIGDALGKGAVFLLIPLYTTFLTSDEYGILTFTKALNPIFRIIFSFGIEGAAFRFFYIYTDPKERKQFYGSIWVFVILIASSFSLLITVFGSTFFSLLLKQISFSPYIKLTVWTTFFRVGFELIYLQFLRASEEPKTYLILNIVSFILFIGSQVISINILNSGVVGALWGSLLSNMFMAIIYATLMIKDFSLNINYKYIKAALNYGIPLIPHQFSNWGLNLSDRVILDRFVTLSEIAIYSLADQFRQGDQLISNALENSTRPIYGRASIDKNQIKDLPKFITYFLVLIMLIGMLIIVFAPDVIEVIAPPEYKAASRIVPWLILSVIFQGFYWVPMNLLTQLLGKTKRIAWITFTAAIVNISLNMIFVPRYGIQAAAINTSVGYFILFSLIFFRVRREIIINFEYLRIIKVLAVTAIVVFCSFLLPSENLVVSLLLKSIIIALFPIGLLLVGFFSHKELVWLKEKYNNYIISAQR